MRYINKVNDRIALHSAQPAGLFSVHVTSQHHHPSITLEARLILVRHQAYQRYRRQYLRPVSKYDVDRLGADILYQELGSLKELHEVQDMREQTEEECARNKESLVSVCWNDREYV